MSNIVKNMQNISRNNSLGDFSRWKRWKHFWKKKKVYCIKNAEFSVILSKY